MTITSHESFHSHLLTFSLRRPPHTLPVLGNAIKFLQPRHVLFNWFGHCQKLFGLETYEISVPTLPPGVVIQDPVNLEFVLKNEKHITKGEFFRRRTWDLFGWAVEEICGACPTDTSRSWNYQCQWRAMESPAKSRVELLQRLKPRKLH